MLFVQRKEIIFLDNSSFSSLFSLFADLSSAMNMTLLKKSVKQFLIRRHIDQPLVSYVGQACHH